MTRRSAPRRAILAALVGLLAGPAAFAGEDRHAPSVPLLPLYRQECAACHVAYPPGMLPADSWRRLLNTLPHHFGTDASLDPATVAELVAWLQANAGTSRRGSEAPPENRITRSEWFVRKHDEVPRSAWSRPAVKSAAHCAACHTQADQGDFNEHTVHIPR